MSDEQPAPQQDPIDRVIDAVPAASAISKDVLDQLRKELKAEILAEFKEENATELAVQAMQVEKCEEEYARYARKMANADDLPWLCLVGMVKDKKGVASTLDWNDAFLDYARAGGITGSSDDEVVHKYLLLVMGEITDSLNKNTDTSEESEFE